MTQDQINVILVILPITIPFIQFLLNKYFGRGKDKAEYSSDLLQIANDATEQLRKAREDVVETEERYQGVIDSIRKESEASLHSMREESAAKIKGLEGRIQDLERVTKLYNIRFDLITHPNIEIRNVEVKPMDDLSASQKLKAISQDDINKAKK